MRFVGMYGYLLLCAACIGLCAASEKARFTVLAFGDSTTAPRKVGDAELEVYADRIAAALARDGVNAQVINAGVPSDTTVHGRERFEADVLRHEPDLVIIQFGLNDSCIDVRLGADTPRVALEDYIDHLRYFVETLTARDSRVILMTPNPMLWTEKLKELYGRAPYDPEDRWGFNLLNREYAAAVGVLAREMDVPLVDVYQEFSNYDRQAGQSLNDLLLDGMHPNARGHALIADSLMDIILQLGFTEIARNSEPKIEGSRNAQAIQN